jgi:2,3-bisphosphoglycerate-independent phosphoglycerate mutase
MQITMDRYEADWAMVERGWHTHVLADARRFASATEAVQTLRAETKKIDQDLPAFCVEPVAPIQDGEAVVMFNFRGDRAIEISRAFDDDKLDKLDRVRRPDVLYAGMMEYDGDLHIPKHYLVQPPEIERPMGEILAASHVTQLAISETQKYGHVTYFWNGNRSGMFDDGTETYIEIPSDRVPFEVLAVETVDLQLARLAAAVQELQGILVVTADHGNADEMFQRDKSGRVQRDKKTGAPVAKTSHTLNPVPFLIHDPMRGDRYEIDPDRAKTAGIASVTATCLELLGFTPPDDLEYSLLRFR